MNAEQYTALCDACDQVLLTPGRTIERVAIPWLHVLNEHPTNLTRYEGLFGGKPSESLLGVKSALLTLLQLCKRRRAHPVWHSSVPGVESADVVIVSHLLNASQAGMTEDFYFGRLPEILRENGIASVVVLHDHTGHGTEELLAKWSHDMAPRVLFPRTLSARGEFDLRKCLQREAASLRTEAKQCGATLHRRVLERAATQAVSHASIGALRFQRQMLAFCRQLRPKAVIATYEGHAWERLAFAAARGAVPTARCIGYHHAILFPRQHAIKRSLGSEFDPDVVLTAGDVTRDILSRARGLQRTKVTTVGTHRQEEAVAALSDKLSRHQLPACLVIPDGTIEECLTIFNFVLQVAPLAPGIRFIIRMHPVMPFDAIAAVDRRLAQLPVNVEISRESIGRDFDRSRWALYRGSGAAIRAVAAGLRPFYVTRPNELSIDPLYELRDWRCAVSTAEEFLRRTDRDLQSDIVSLNAELESARGFCIKYFKPVNLQTFRDEIVGAGEARSDEVLVSRQR